MQLVAARLRDDAGRGAAGAAVLGRRALGEDAELGDRVHRELQRVAAVHAVHVLRAVHQIDVLLGPHAVHGVGLALPQACRRRWSTPAVSGATPVCSSPSCVKLRPFSGRSTSLAAGDDAPERVGRGVDQLRAARSP